MAWWCLSASYIPLRDDPPAAVRVFMTAALSRCRQHIAGSKEDGNARGRAQRLAKSFQA